MRMSWSGRHAVAALLSFPLAFGISLAAAQDADLQGKLEEIQSRYEEALTKGDIETLTSLFTEDGVYLPATGGSFEGTEAIRGHFEKGPTPEALDIRSTRTETVGDMILDIGTFTMTLPQDAGGGSFEGEYVVLAEQTDQGLRIERLVAFPARKPMEAGQ